MFVACGIWYLADVSSVSPSYLSYMFKLEYRCVARIFREGVRVGSENANLEGRGGGRGHAPPGKYFKI